jgi:hypothetical protein
MNPPLIPPNGLVFESSLDYHSAIKMMIKCADPLAIVRIRPCRRKIPKLIVRPDASTDDWLHWADELAGAIGKKIVRDRLGCYRLQRTRRAPKKVWELPRW